MAYTVAPRLPDTAAPDATLYVHPGRMLAATNGSTLTTVVGSGIAVCIWDPMRGVGGMSHFLLPDSGHAATATRFGDVAMSALVEQIAGLGGDVRRLRARVFGGSAPPLGDGGPHLGDRNVEAAMAFLTAHTILCVQREVGGKGARKVLFSPKGGAAEVSHIGQ